MLRRLLICAFAALFALSALSCATAGYAPSQTSMPAARAGLPPEERFFYDALRDYGEWVLIEPWGWVFQPRVNWVAWRPYQNGFWAPTDLYGWTWISTEPFGWATFHYGQWMYDRFQGWVWIPGLDWGPAWVAWNLGDEYVGWAPLMPSESYWHEVPGGAFLYVQTSQLMAADLPRYVVKEEQIRNQIGRLQPVANLEQHGGVKFNRGPAFGDIERVIGAPLPRVKLEDRGPAFAPPAGRGAKSLRPPHAPAADTAAVVRHAAEEAAREARAISASPSHVPDTIPVVRPMPSRRPAEEGSGGDSSGDKGAGEPREHRAAPHTPRPGLEKPASRDTSG